MDAYAADKARIYTGVTHSCVYNVEAPATERMVEEADVTDGARAIGFTTGIPAVSMLGVVDDLLVDRAFIPQRRDSAIELAKVSDVVPSAPHNIANALAAAALARSFGVTPAAVSKGLKSLVIGGHRIQTVAVVDGITWVDDSKATNPHAADSSLRAFSPVVWIAGGQAKNTSFDDLVERHKDRLHGAVLLGVDRELHPRGPRPTRARGPRDRRGQHRHWGNGRGGARCALPGSAGVTPSCSRPDVPPRTCTRATTQGRRLRSRRQTAPTGTG
jgi:UDP-N-acetylmuramoylalanine--D-glutamate ligase